MESGHSSEMALKTGQENARAIIYIWFMLAMVSGLVVPPSIGQLIFMYILKGTGVASLGISFLIGIPVTVIPPYVYLIFRKHQGQQLIGPFGRSAVHAITVFSALILVHTAADSVSFIIALVSSTLYLHALAQLMHAADDISLLDAFVGVLMQIVVYCWAPDNSYTSIAIVGSCVGVIFLRYWFYSVPYSNVYCSNYLVSETA